MDVTIAQVQQADQWSDEDRLWWRARQAQKACGDTPTNISNGQWVAKTLVYWCVLEAPQFAYYVVLRMPMGIDVAAASPGSGTRVVRLLYDWQEHVSPHLHMAPAQLRDTVLCALGKEGERLRAAVRYARTCRNGGGR